MPSDQRGEPDVEHRRLARADRPRDQGRDARRVLGRGGGQRVVRALGARGVERLHGIGEGAVQAGSGEDELDAHRLEVGLGACGGREHLERARETGQRGRELGVLRVEGFERLGRRRSPLPVLDAEGDGASKGLRLLAAPGERPLGHHRQRRGELLEHRGTIDDQAPPRREGAEPLDVVDLAERRAPRRVDEPPEQGAQGALERRRQLA